MDTERMRQPPRERFAVESTTLDLRTELEALRAEDAPTRHGHRQKSLFKHGGRTIALFMMDAGATLPEHGAAGTVTVQPIEGVLMMVVAGKEEQLVSGQILIMPPRIRHAVTAITAAVFLLQVSLE